jgi:glutathione synthase/RimK-type ligase-like ATP-grasp enzyme
VAESLDALRAAIQRCGAGFYISSFVDKVAEYRIFCAQGRVGCVASKTPADASSVAWNVYQGGSFTNVRWDEWPLRAIKAALEARTLSGLDFSGVDVMVDRQGKPFILEINSAPSLTSEYRQRCFARIFDYIVDHGKDPIPLVTEKGGYTKFIHPAISDKARI